jgi:hypothetical protein
MNTSHFLAVGVFYLMNQFNVRGGGIEGQVIIRPIVPIERPGIVNYHPYQATVTVLDQNVHFVAEFQSSADGHFRVNLKSGTYVLRPESDRPFPRAPKQIVTVSENEFTQVCITYDSGIR